MATTKRLKIADTEVHVKEADDFSESGTIKTELDKKQELIDLVIESGMLCVKYDE